MLSIKDISLSKKLVGGFGLVSILLIIVALVSITNLVTIDQEANKLIVNEIAAKEKTLEINVNMLEARRNENNFFARKDLIYVDKVKASVTNVTTDAEEIRKLDIPKERKDMAVKMITAIAGYQKAFLEVVELNKEKGLNESSGLQDQQILAARAVENVLKTQNDYLLRWIYLNSGGMRRIML